MTTSSCVLLGNETLTVECGERLLAAGWRVEAVVTRRDETAAWARGAGLTVLPGARALDASDIAFDWLFSIANLEMIPERVLARAAAGAVNFHDGPLPAYAGLNAPVWAILAGETRHGITWHMMEAGADTGDILVSVEVPVSADETALTLNAKCFAAAVESFDAVLAEIAAGCPGRRAQDRAGRSYFGLAHRPEGMARLHGQLSTEAALRLVRALDHGAYDNPVAAPWIWTDAGPVLVGAAFPADGAGAPGEVLGVDAGAVTVAFGGGALRLTRLTDAMGASIDPTAFFRMGNKLAEPADLDASGAGEIARAEPRWRARLADYRPAALTARGGTPGRHTVPLSLPGGLGAAGITAAFGAVIAAAAGGEPADLALAMEGEGPFAAPFVPVRYDAGATWGAALQRVEADLRFAGEAGPMAFDLAARIAGLPVRRMPDAAVSETGPLPGAVLTFVTDPAAPRLEADTARISAAEADILGARLQGLLDALADLSPDTALQDLPLLPEAERRLVMETFNATDTDFPRDLCLHQGFEAQVARTPDAAALTFEATTLTYAELNARANRLAHVLIGLGVGPGQPVGLHMARSEGLVIAALGILKAGGAYVPLDPEYPADRIEFYAADSGAKVIVSETGLPEVCPEGAVRLLADSDARLAEAQETDPDTGVSGEDLAYLIYTSGSTGTPKGVMIEHRNAQNFFTGMDDRIPHDGRKVWLAVTSLSFDISVLELFWTLSRGFEVVLLGDEKFVAGGAETGDGHGAVEGGMDFSLYYWGNDDGVGQDKYTLLLEGAKFADDNGFQAVWTPERHFHAFGGLYPNPSVTGAAVAAITKHIGVRAGSCVAPLHHPARIAEEWAVIDNLTGGRAGLAFASGWQPDDFVLRPENAPPNNKPALAQAIEDVRKLWRGEPLLMKKADGTEVERLTQPRPVSKELPVWVTTAGNPETWKQAGEAGANVLTHLLGQTIEEVGEKIKLYHAALRDAGHDPAKFTVTLMLHTFIADDRDTAREIAREPMKDYLRAAADLIKQYAWAFPAFKKPMGVETARELDLGSLEKDELEAILDFAFERYFERSGLFGTVEDALARVAEVKAIGVTEVACLIDYGIERQVILDGLTRLARVRAAANAGAAAGDYSIAAQIRRRDVTHLQCTPYMARMFLENDEASAALGRVKHLMIGGEAMPAALVSDLRKVTKASIENMYGPTETTIWSTTGPGSDADAIVSVGKPIANTQLYVLDDAMRPLGVGAVGQLWIGGEGVARGYWNREELSAEKFIDNPFAPGRMFGTGDLARWRADGTLDFLGRADTQIKIRGYRIELGEIEADMEDEPGVTKAVAVVRADATGVGQICAYYTGNAEVSALREALSERLPVFMVPARFMPVQSFPLTPNRKIDRKALPDPFAAPAAVAASAPVPQPVAETAPGAPVEVPTEAAIAALWQRILGVPKVQPSDNFFDLGGHSLLAISMHREMKATFGVTTLSIADVFRAPTLAGLHAVVAEKAAKGAPAGAPAPSAAPAAEDNEVMSKRKALRASRQKTG